jgi:hypothetical protein
MSTARNASSFGGPIPSGSRPGDASGEQGLSSIDQDRSTPAALSTIRPLTNHRLTEAPSLGSSSHACVGGARDGLDVPATRRVSYRFADLDQGRLVEWEQFDSTLRVGGKEAASFGPEGSLELYLDSAFREFVTIEWDVWPQLKEVRAKFETVLQVLDASLGGPESYLHAPRCACCGNRTRGEIAESNAVDADGFMPAADYDASVTADEVSAEGEGEEPDDLPLTWGFERCILKLYGALQTAAWLGHLGQVQALAHAICALDHLFGELIDVLHSLYGDEQVA